MSIAAGHVSTKTLESDVGRHPHFSGSQEGGGEKKTRSVFERYNIVSVGDLREAARRLDIATGTISGTIEEIRRSGSKV